MVREVIGVLRGEKLFSFWDCERTKKKGDDFQRRRLLTVFVLCFLLVLPWFLPGS